MNLAININGIEYKVSDYTKQDFIDMIVDGEHTVGDLRKATTELPLSIFNPTKGKDTEYLDEKVEAIISDEWDVLNEFINNNGHNNPLKSNTMNLAIVYPNGTEVSVNEFDKSMLVDELYEYWEGGYNISDITTELPKSIIDLSKFDAELITLLNVDKLKLNQATEDHVKEALEQCINDDWDVLNGIINNNGEDFAAACLEYANGSDLSGAEDKYIGQWDSDRDYVMDTFLACNEVPEHLKNYLDWDQIENDYMMDITEINGYYFNS